MQFGGPRYCHYRLLHRVLDKKFVSRSGPQKATYLKPKGPLGSWCSNLVLKISSRTRTETRSVHGSQAIGSSTSQVACGTGKAPGRVTLVTRRPASFRIPSPSLYFPG